jgi:hypothetical protein
MALEPACALIIGLVLLGQIPDAAGIVGMICVATAVSPPSVPVHARIAPQRRVARRRRPRTWRSVAIAVARAATRRPLRTE